MNSYKGLKKDYWLFFAASLLFKSVMGKIEGNADRRKYDIP